MRALEGQLKSEGIDMSLQPDQTTQWFNTVWADNGDAISKQVGLTPLNDVLDFKTEIGSPFPDLVFFLARSVHLLTNSSMPPLPP